MALTSPFAMQRLRSRSSSSSNSNSSTTTLLLPRTIDDLPNRGGIKIKKGIPSPPSSSSKRRIPDGPPLPPPPPPKMPSPPKPPGIAIVNGTPVPKTPKKLQHLTYHKDLEKKQPPKRNFCKRFLWSIAMTGLLVGIFFVGSHFKEEEMKKKIVVLEKARDKIAETQVKVSNELEQARKLLQNKDTSPSADAPSILELQENIQRLQQEIKTEKDATLHVQKELQLKQEKMSEMESSNSKKLKEAEAKGIKQVKDLEKSIQKMHKAQAIERFGEGPHFVEFEVGIPHHNVMHFTIEMASLEHMPVTVNMFLQQIEKGLWRKGSIFLDAGHVMMFRPVSPDGRWNRRDEFGSLKHLPFAEYSPKYPHAEYTLGLNGRPSGPDFYINRKDNTIPHGPKGHQHYGLAEPCFARIILGRETIDLISKLPKKEKESAMLERPVEIRSTKILKSLEIARGGPDYIAEQEATRKEIAELEKAEEAAAKESQGDFQQSRARQAQESRAPETQYPPQHQQQAQVQQQQQQRRQQQNAQPTHEQQQRQQQQQEMQQHRQEQTSAAPRY
mmetsp:Transcript_25775/g.59896  ORF Transcript_25775/g.59896 Transcript_25775/m.59896 type:complete len:557 (-) Transcript_25775:119-1789(-)|eukprot:CAMPEP_0116849730 /NCGR_PEP_ID=MMETSP0418-20121206/15749_1 /TAXON_ID=1158023 /ORGANISM="Astrosyne radiata, Strain 13vi08-1A" /LENGTH=556 /DNA_ID=CAMNT_0004481513 /DNA_START=100 /DNA_END=1770 /DNA_ORIENTATION=-